MSVMAALNKYFSKAHTSSLTLHYLVHVALPVVKEVVCRSIKVICRKPSRYITLNLIRQSTALRRLRVCSYLWLFAYVVFTYVCICIYGSVKPYLIRYDVLYMFVYGYVCSAHVCFPILFSN